MCRPGAVVAREGRLNKHNRTQMEILVGYRWWKHLQDGTKVVEGRLGVMLDKPAFVGLKTAGSRVVFVPVCVPAEAGQLANPRLEATVLRCKLYPTFRAMLEEETLARVLPGVATIEEGVSVYRAFYSEASELKHGALAITVQISQ